MRCPVCGYDNLTGAEVCDNCGADLAGSDVPQDTLTFHGRLMTSVIALSILGGGTALAAKPMWPSGHGTDFQNPTPSGASSTVVTAGKSVGFFEWLRNPGSNNISQLFMAVTSSVDPLVREALQACRLFAGLDDAGIALCASALRVRKFRRGEVIFHEGDPGDSLSIVSKGSVKILVTPEDGAEPAIMLCAERAGAGACGYLCRFRLPSQFERDVPAMAASGNEHGRRKIL